MKRFTKKYLMLLITIVALITVTMFAASAAEECKHNFPSHEGNVISPTCTTEGYTEVVCGGCEQVIGRLPGADKPANGHSYEWKMVVNGDHYENNGQCKVCYLNTIERDNNSDIVTYYAVTFLNPAAVKSYDESIPYTKLVKERVGMDDAKELGVAYVKDGGKLTVKQLEGITPGCEKDIKYGQYSFIGWFNQGVIEDAPPAVSTIEDLVKYDMPSVDNPDAGFTVTENTNLYAGFRGKDISYDVRFYDYNGRALAVAKAVPHGKAAIYNLDLPTKEADVKFRYKFNYWSFGGKEVDLTAIFGDVAVTADYVSIAREYNVSYYYDAECTKPIINKDIVVKDSKVKYGASATNGLAIPPVVLEKEADDQYIYAWTGKWVLANRQNYIVSLDSFSVPAGTPDALDGSAEVRLIPKYDRQLRVYELKVTIIYPDDNNYHPDDVSVQILYADGKIADGRKATKVAENTYEFISYVNYSTHYTISASSIGYSGTTISNFVVGPSGAIIVLEKVGAFSCGCICHTFLKPIWVRILNLLYTLFGVEHVCCNDMFANIGPQLKYGPGKN